MKWGAKPRACRRSVTGRTYGHRVPEAHEQMASVVSLTLAGAAKLTLKALPAPVDDEPELEFDGDEDQE